MDTVQVLLIATNQLIAQLVAIMPKLIISLIIWYLGRYLISVAGKLLRGLDLKGTSIDNRAVETLIVVINAVGTVILVLVILDYLGIGTSVVGALAQGVTFAVSIALGLAFGRALEPDAKDVVDSLKKVFLNHSQEMDKNSDGDSE